MLSVTTAVLGLGLPAAPAAGRMLSEATCTPSATNICVTFDPYAGETGYYKFDGGATPSPTITVKIDDTITFDQTDPSNWYHPIGFAYEPDGAHGSTWGGDELPEVEGAGELLYKIDGAATTCADAGDTGLDCYEPEFFYPRGDWSAKSYTVSHPNTSVFFPPPQLTSAWLRVRRPSSPSPRPWPRARTRASSTTSATSTRR